MACGNQDWPAFYFVDVHGRVRFHRFGEGGYDGSEAIIRTLLLEAESDRSASDLPPRQPGEF
jgi:hypothetical protein